MFPEPRFLPRSHLPHARRETRNHRSGNAATGGQQRNRTRRADRGGDLDARGEVTRDRNTENHRRLVLLRITSERPRCATVVVNIKICCSLGGVCRIHLDSGDAIAEKYRALTAAFQVQKTLEPAEARAISRRTRFEGEASADEAYSPGSGAVQVSGRWKRAILCPTTRPVRKTHKSG